MLCMEMIVMSSASASKKVIGTGYSLDLLLFGDPYVEGLNWQYGECACLKIEDEKMRIQEINSWAESSQSDYLLLWNKAQYLPEPEVLFSIMERGVDIAHCGLKQGLDAYFEDLCLLGFSWDKLNAPAEIVNTSWRLGLEACLLRRKLFLSMSGLDTVFNSQAGAGLEFGYRSLKLGAIIEYRPEICKEKLLASVPEPSTHDFYCFVLRHFGLVWGSYVFFRRMGRTVNWVNEIRSWRSAHEICKIKQANWSLEKNSIHTTPGSAPLDHSYRVSVIIPTLGRYEYIPGALKSLLEQTVPIDEVIVVDQNLPAVRQPEIYKGYEKLNLRVIWQDERGQSLARNTGLAAAKGEYVFLFDDDSVAYPDLIECHLAAVLSGKYDVSTGVALPPSPNSYTIPQEYRTPRLSQTFDTGNSLLRLDLIRRLGGLDRNFDFGPGADADLGTRLYLAGCRILHNPDAMRIHFKASGGLRIYGAHKYNTDAGFLQPFPPITQSYYFLRYLTSRQRRETVLLGFFLAKFPKSNRRFDKLLATLPVFLISLLVLPLKQKRSLSRALALLRQGIRLEKFCG
jgi:glycosyltransferase involved in cell wall biosynthesis